MAQGKITLPLSHQYDFMSYKNGWVTEIAKGLINNYKCSQIHKTQHKIVFFK